MQIPSRKVLPVVLLLLVGSAVFVFSQLDGGLTPLRKVQDPYPVFTDVAVDPAANIVAVTDENLFSLRTYDRDTNSNEIADPRTVITGPKTEIDFACGIALDPIRREILAANNDTNSTLLAFSYDANGEVPPSRQLSPASTGTWGVAVDLVNDEVAVTVEHINKVAVFRRLATGADETLRFIQGPNTGLSDPHGIFIDAQHNEIFVANHDSFHEVQSGEDYNKAVADYAKGIANPNAERERQELRPSKGKFVEHSIAVYSRTASGNVAPLRVIQGPRTQLGLPMKVFVDTVHDELFVANSGTSSVLVFSRTAAGDVAPIRKIEGPATKLRKPVGLFVDTKNDEVWVTNPGEHAVTVYKRTAQGNVAPLRTLRGAPEGTPAPGIGNPGGIAYDPLREQILVPN